MDNEIKDYIDKKFAEMEVRILATLEAGKITMGFGNKEKGFEHSEYITEKIPDGVSPEEFHAQMKEKWSLVFFSSFNDLLEKRNEERFPQGINGTDTAPICAICRAPMKISKSGKNWVCTKAQWSKKQDGTWVNTGCSGSREV